MRAGLEEFVSPLVLKLDEQGNGGKHTHSL